MCARGQKERVTFFVVWRRGGWDLQNGMLLHAGLAPVAEVVVENHGALQQGFPARYTSRPNQWLFVQGRQPPPLLNPPLP